MNIIAWIVVVLVSATAGYIGSLMISKRISLIAGPLGHLALPGVALALLLNFNVFAGALIFIFIGGIMIWMLKQISNLPFEALTGITFAFGLSVGFLFLPMAHAEEAIMGDITKIDILDLYIAILFSFSIVFIINKLYKNVVLLTLSTDLAKTLGVDVGMCELIYLICIAFVAAMEVKIVGGILTVALIILPPSIAMQFARNLREYQLSATFIGMIMSLIGLTAYELVHLPAGPLIVLSGFALFLISLGAKHIKHILKKTCP